MDILGHEFVYLCEIEPSRDAKSVVLCVMPQAKYRNLRALPLNKYGSGPFCKFVISRQHRICGVYALISSGNVLYIGECADLSSRFNAGYGNISPKNCFKGGQETNCRLNSLIYGFALAGRQISLWFFQTSERKSVERTLRQRLSPDWNRI
jgi:hypothetical protein